MTRVLLIRHGAVEADGRCYGRRRDPALSPLGRGEASALRARLPERCRAVRSPARRAAQTAELLGLGDARVDDRLSERDFGEWEGRAWEDIWAETPASVATDPAAYATHVPPGGESLAQVTDRVLEALDALVGAGTGEPLVVITHGGPVRVAVAHALGLDAPAMLRLRPSTGSLTSLTRWPDDSWTMDRMGAREERTWD